MASAARIRRLSTSTGGGGAHFIVLIIERNAVQFDQLKRCTSFGTSAWAALRANALYESLTQTANDAQNFYFVHVLVSLKSI
jgi:hypothetical protein